MKRTYTILAHVLSLWKHTPLLESIDDNNILKSSVNSSTMAVPPPEKKSLFEHLQNTDFAGFKNLFNTSTPKNLHGDGNIKFWKVAVAGAGFVGCCALLAVYVKYGAKVPSANNFVAHFVPKRAVTTNINRENVLLKDTKDDKVQQMFTKDFTTNELSLNVSKNAKSQTALDFISLEDKQKRTFR